jgi:hypothetical protein
METLPIEPKLLPPMSLRASGEVNLGKAPLSLKFTS